MLLKMRIKYYELFLTLLCFISLNLILSTKTYAEKIDSFNSDVQINKDGTVDIVETIKYDFETSQKHGLLRNLYIKRTNQDGKTYITDIFVNSVTNENGQPYKYSTSKIGNYMELKVGDADKLITGKKTYILKYKINGALTYFTDHDEFYWNLIGFDWNYPILHYSSSISLPQNINQNDIKYVCYEGIKGSTSQTCLINYVENNIKLSSSRVLNPGENITVTISFPKNIVAVLEPREDKPSIILKIFQIFLGLGASIWYVFFPIKYLVNTLREKNFLKKNQRIVSAWFDPPKYDDGTSFSPAETGFIVDNKIDHRELTATIIQLAQRGFLKIKEDEKKHFSFIRLKSSDSPELRIFEKQVMEALFKEGIDINDLDANTAEMLGNQIANLEKFNKFIKIPGLLDMEKQLKGEGSESREEVKDSDLKKSKTLFSKIVKFNNYVEEEIVEKGMYNEKPSVTLGKNMLYMGLGLTTMNMFLAIVSIVFGKDNIKRTEKGIEKYSEAKSLLNFIKSQDEQLNFQAKNQMFFEKLLPYAAAFGVEKIWAERFKDIVMAKPDWYEGSNFTNSVFVSSMTRSIGGSMKSAYSSGMSSTRSSSGFSSGFSGGHSGGGGGGGGGGSW